MKTIYKYRFDMDKSEQTIELPMGARILCVANQLEHLTMWAVVDPRVQQTAARRFYVIGTGQDNVPEDNDDGYILYRGTAQFMGGLLVLHVFERVERYLSQNPLRKGEL